MDTVAIMQEQEMLDASSQVSSLGSKLRCLDAELSESQRSESRLSIELQEERVKYKTSRQELENLKGAVKIVLDFRINTVHHFFICHVI